MTEVGTLVNLDEERQARVMRGGGNPPGYGGGQDWLRPLSEGTRFLAKRKGVSGSEVPEWIVGMQRPEMPVALLLTKSEFPPFPPKAEWHDTAEFSKMYQLYCVLEVIPNDDSKHLHKGPVDEHAGPEIRDQGDDDD